MGRRTEGELDALVDLIRDSQSPPPKHEAADCYASITSSAPIDALPDAISQVCAAIDKFRDAPESAECHLQAATIRMASCLPGWEPDEFQQVEVDAAVDAIFILRPELFN